MKTGSCGVLSDTVPLTHASRVYTHAHVVQNMKLLHLMTCMCFSSIHTRAHTHMLAHLVQNMKQLRKEQGHAGVSDNNKCLTEFASEVI